VRSPDRDATFALAGDGVVDAHDVSGFLDKWFTARERGTLDADGNRDGAVNGGDVREYISSWRGSVEARRK